jgi:hypothetical protein
MMSKSKFVIGIDLGTTNCTLAYAPLHSDDTPSHEDIHIEQFAIPQITKNGLEEEGFSLPSFIYFPLEEEQENKIASISWNSARPFCVGTFAQNRGGELPTRLIASSKSWLCHPGIDRREPALPIMGEEDVKKMSPLEACTELLRHLKEGWDHKMENPFVEQQVLITMPASFDPSARQLVQEAAKNAEYPEIILLEEPQASFYGWLHVRSKDWREELQIGDCVLVVDIGGGTTDFSLIGVDNEAGDLILKRLAVGTHLLLGGDNIDLSLAHFVKGKLEEKGHDIDDWQFQALIQSCRKAKELLMAEAPPAKVDVTILGRGSRLVGGALKMSVTIGEMQTLIIDGFAPLVAPEERSLAEKRAGLQQIGLPYAQDARLTSQLAKFLSMTGEVNSESMEHFTLPTAVLFNGGTTKATALRHRLLEQLNQWADALGKSPVKELPGADYDFSVSRGAVHYGMARIGKAIRIRSGTSRSYFIGVEDAMPAVPGIPTPLKALCIAPFGMEEGQELQLDTQEFSLVVGEPATFRFFSHATPKLSDGTEPVMGTSVRKWKQELTELHPIEANLDHAKDDGKTIRVKIGSKVTELGMLEVWCHAADGRKWKLEFDIRKDQS